MIKQTLLITVAAVVFMSGCAIIDPTIKKQHGELKASGDEANTIKREKPIDYEDGVALDESGTVINNVVVSEGTVSDLEGKLSRLEKGGQAPGISEYKLRNSYAAKDRADNLNVGDFFYKLSFGFNEYQIPETDAEQFKKIANLISFLRMEDLSEYKIVIEGNADQRGTDEFNYALGIKRANFIKEQILLNTPILTENIKTVSFGETNPMCASQDENCYKKNRRVEIFLKK